MTCCKVKYFPFRHSEKLEKQVKRSFSICSESLKHGIREIKIG